MKRILQTAAIIVLLGLQIWSCADDQFIGRLNENAPPTVWLASAPPEGTVSNYRLHLWWGGWDPDGEIDHYEYVITNNDSGIFDPADTTSTPGDYKWKRVFAADSVFTFSADLIPDSSAIDFDGGIVGDGDLQPEEFRRSHTFFIRAVDQQGRRSAKPAYRSFTSRTLSPTVYVEIPAPSALNEASVPPITTFRWRAKDYVTELVEEIEPDSVRTILVNTAQHGGGWDQTLRYIQQNPDAPEWSDWRWYQAPDDSGLTWTSKPQAFGTYYFAVQVKDEAGAVSPVFDLDNNLRRIRVSPRLAGPQMAVRNRFIGQILTSSPNTSPVILDLPANVTMQFEVRADASSYGGIVSGYRYGWDILDLNDPTQWEIDYTPFLAQNTWAKSSTRKFFFGTHSFFVEVIDNNGYKSRVEVQVNVVPFSFQKPLLLVDDWVEGSAGFLQTKGGLPSDAEHDAFWASVLDSVAGWDSFQDVVELNVGGKKELPLQDMAVYKTIIWVAVGSPNARSGSKLKDLVVFADPNLNTGSTKVSPPLVALFMAAGGRVMLVGESIMTLAIQDRSFSTPPPRYPFIFRYELTGDQEPPYQESQVGVRGVGEESFAYLDCCLNTLDLTYLGNGAQIRQPSSGGGGQQPGSGCPVQAVRSNNRLTDGLRSCLPLDNSTGGGFPRMDLRPEVAGDPSLNYHSSRTSLVADVYNPRYFPIDANCRNFAEYPPNRSCFTPIFGNGCLNTSSKIYNAPVAFWTGTHKDRVPEGGGIVARSVVWGFHPVFFNPAQVKKAVGIIVHDEWKLPKK